MQKINNYFTNIKAKQTSYLECLGRRSFHRPWTPLMETTQELLTQHHLMQRIAVAIQQDLQKPHLDPGTIMTSKFLKILHNYTEFLLIRFMQKACDLSHIMHGASA